MNSAALTSALLEVLMHEQPFNKRAAVAEMTGSEQDASLSENSVISQ
jgi:hypothetical protein